MKHTWIAREIFAETDFYEILKTHQVYHAGHNNTYLEKKHILFK